MKWEKLIREWPPVPCLVPPLLAADTGHGNCEEPGVGPGRDRGRRAEPRESMRVKVPWEAGWIQ